MSDWRSTAGDVGLLLMRLGLGAMFIVAHGWDKISGGEKTWRKDGGAMKYVGVDDYHEVFGFLAAFSEFGGGILLVLGLFVRPAAFLLACTMAVAATMHLSAGDGLKVASHAIESGFAFLGLMLLGGGRYSLDRRLFGR